MSWDRRHLIDVEDFSADDVAAVMAEAARLRARLDDGAGWLENLRGRSVALFFSEASTRTRLSFELAARRLGAQTFVLDPGASSLTKGESFVDTVRNLDAIGFDYLVVRHHRAGAAAVAARHFTGHVLNAGDGWHAHPTQALLDLFTLVRLLGDGGSVDAPDLRGRKVVIVGDIAHSRVARSNAFTLTRAGADVWLCAPRNWLREVPGATLTLSDDLATAVEGAAAVMALRVQKERMRGGVALDDYINRFQITEERLARLAPDAMFMHPGPINEGIEVTREVALGPRSVVLEQARNGVPVRMAALSLLGRGDGGGRGAGRGAGRGGAAGQATDATRALSSLIR
jgi:aspartate carbamoyltransferase catalytic subunit